MFFAKHLIPWTVPGSILALTVGLTSCADSTAVREPVLLKGAGATFPAPLYQRWITEYSNSQKNNNLTIAYDSVGSGKGVENFLAQSVDFGASDAPLKEDERKSFPSDRVKPVQVPMTGGLLVFAYNLSEIEGADDLKLSRGTYCGVVTGKIKNWDDPKIAADNPNVNLPDLPIIFVHRSDGSGTTFIFTNHLKSACPDWKAGSGKKVEWPVGMGAEGNEGVSAQIQQTQGAIGYTEYSFAKDKNLQRAVIQNKAGQFIKPSPESAAKAFVGVDVPSDFALVIPDPPASDAYPIVGLTWLLLYGKYDDPGKVDALKNFIKWSLNEGDRYASDLGYLPIPNELQEKVINTINTL
jgi:phosphate transport system substrate-binding protein